MLMGISTPRAVATVYASPIMSRASGPASGSLRDLRHARLRQCADGVEREVAQQLHPDLLPDVPPHRRAQPRADDGRRDGLGPLRGCAVELAQREPVALLVLDDARLHDGRGGVHHAADDLLGGDVLGDDAAGVDALQPRAFPRAAVPLEVPPRNAVLRGQHDGVRPDERRQQRRNEDESVRLDGQHDDVRVPDLRRVVCGEDFGREVAVRAAHHDAALPHRRQVRPPRNQRDVLTREAQLGPQIRANSPRAVDREFHDVLFTLYGFRRRNRDGHPFALSLSKGPHP